MYIFYDFETSQREFSGQILSYAFICLDEDWQEIDRLVGLVKISRLQLPDPLAINTNKINVIEHQKQAKFTEKEAALEIYSFIHKIIKSSKSKPVLIGYNSNKFDLVYLRTTLIRNGLNPYFNNNLLYRDLLHGIRKLYCANENFKLAPVLNDKNELRISFSLETIAKQFDILASKQSHTAIEDVRLCISLAKKIYDDFNFDLRKYDSYEVKNASSGSYVIVKEIEYDPSIERRYNQKKYFFLDQNNSASLWVDFDKYQDTPDRRAVKYINKNTAALFVFKQDIDKQGSVNIKKNYSGLNVANYFTDPDCDIEEHIYMIDFSSIEALNSAIWQQDESIINKLKIKNKKLDQIYIRYKLREYQLGTSNDSSFYKVLKQYAEYRYGGKLKFKSFDDQEPIYHKTLTAMLNEVNVLIEQSVGGQGFLQALKEFYLNSEIFKFDINTNYS